MTATATTITTTQTEMSAKSRLVAVLRRSLLIVAGASGVIAAIAAPASVGLGGNHTEPFSVDR